MLRNRLTPKAGTAPGAPVRVLLVEDHAFVRELMASLLERETGRYRVVAQAGTAREAIAACREHKPDLLVLDLNLGLGPGGTRALAALRRAHPPVRVLICSGSCDEAEIAAALRAGPEGFVDKGAHRDTFLAAAAAVAAGGRFLCPRSAEVYEAMAHGHHGGMNGKARASERRGGGDGGRGRTGSAPAVAPITLTAREREVLALVAGGSTSKEAAAVLGVSLGTVVSHRANLMRKLDLHNAAELTTYAIAHKLLAQPSARRPTR